MANIIILSSSPPAIFARSPTPVTLSSSPRKAPAPPWEEDVASGHFKAAQHTRDGFSTSFTTARQILGTKANVENIPMSLARIPQSKDISSSKSQPHQHIETATTVSVNTRESPTTKNGSEDDQSPQVTVIKILPSDVKRTRKTRENAPLNLEKAMARRKNWTPERSTATGKISTGIPAFGMDLGASFGHTHLSDSKSTTDTTEDGVSCKRRRIATTPTGLPASSRPVSIARSTKSISKPRSKSPTKKTVTITGLTTSHYLDDDHARQNSTLMMQFLTSTQARMQSDSTSDMFETSVDRKSARSKKGKQRSRLRSPRTSMKTISEQDFVFASASQLARDESPGLLRDTIEAIKQSEESSFAEPDPTQQTIAISIGSISPEGGVARYRGRKNLWAAAHRDENDALLYRNDPFDESNVRAALTGSDVLAEDNNVVQDTSNQGLDSLSLLASLQKDASTIHDIDDIVSPQDSKLRRSPSVQAKRMYSTSSPKSSKRTKVDDPPQQGQLVETTKTNSELQKPKVPPKPNYAAWTDQQLKDQVTEYGFKRLRARKSMIDKLDEHWAQKYGVDIAAVKAATKAVLKRIDSRDHGSFLSSVHELAARPQPKAKKSRAWKSDNSPFEAVSKPKSRSKLVKGPAQSEDPDTAILDIDEIDNTTVLDRLATIQAFPDEAHDHLEPSTAPVKGTGVAASSKTRAKPKGKVKSRTPPSDRPLTPPPTYPHDQDPIIDSSPGFASPNRNELLALSAQEITLKSHIQAALFHTSTSSNRNHQKNPTWHEKILMYDPIVLEEFTAWLNTEGFNGVGVDDEIDAKEVKVWCEENGVCCLWKGGWRGNGKKGEKE